MRKPPLFCSSNRENAGRPNFWQRAIARSQLYGAMRKSSQPRCTAAIFGDGWRDRAEAAAAQPKFGLS
jgi:hypothetical protein